MEDVRFGAEVAVQRHVKEVRSRMSGRGEFDVVRLSTCDW